MKSKDSFSMAHLLVRSFIPSITSASVGLLLSVVLLGLHILFFSLHSGSVTPGLSSNAWIQNYTNFIIHPVEVFFHNSKLNTLLTAVVWGFIGLVIYTSLEAGINAFSAWRTDEHDVHIIDSQKVQLHPLRGLLLTRALWRLLISFLVILLVIFTGTTSHNLLVNLDRALNGTSPAAIASHITLTVISWTLLTHCFVVLLRLFVFRTRLTGELIR